MTKEEVIAAFGVDPDMVGKRPRGWWIVERIDDEEEWVGAQIGDLCVKTRDGASSPIDPNAFRVGHCIGSIEDGFDRTYRYYYYRRLDRSADSPSARNLQIQRGYLMADDAEATQTISVVLFDSAAVYQALSEQARRRTSQENVSDVLDAVVRLLRAADETGESRE